jgi:hypothetical protein
MPLFMDIHKNVEGLSADAAAEAIKRTLKFRVSTA